MGPVEKLLLEILLIRNHDTVPLVLWQGSSPVSQHQDSLIIDVEGFELFKVVMVTLGAPL